MWQVFIEPNDVLLFRDGKPFVAGEDHRARSLFPPTPFTMQGLVRSKVLFDSAVSPSDYASGAPSAQSLYQQIGTSSGTYGQLHLHGPFVAKRNENGSVMRYFTLPSDVIKVGNSHVLVKPLKEAVFRSDLSEGLSLLWTSIDESLKEARGWLADEEFRKYLVGQSDFCVSSDGDLFVREPRFGFALDYTPRRPHEGLLYQMEFLRLKGGVGFLLEVDGITPFQPEKGFVQIGGEARAAQYDVLPQPLLPLPMVSTPTQRVKIILLTPAWFTDGWQPQGGNWAKFFDGGANVRLVSAALPRTQTLGGAFVDDQRRRGDFQKTMRRFVPAGSVFFFESEGLITPSNKPFTETPGGEGDFGQIGFGKAAMTSWEYM
jgi:CRISPR-associated protein Cmr3